MVLDAIIRNRTIRNKFFDEIFNRFASILDRIQGRRFMTHKDLHTFIQQAGIKQNNTSEKNAEIDMAYIELTEQNLFENVAYYYYFTSQFRN